ncbi:MAG TPA: hypothetical protein VFO67_17555 [Gemmatimonadales bacterium]|nr:hypothetical protein [Gemmatimonadales bacterium]
MRPAPFVILALVVASTVSAQTKPEPTIALTISAGVVTGHHLWTVEQQPLCVLNPGGGCTGTYDTLRISRSISPSLILGASGTYFPWPHLGFHAELSYLGLPIDDTCTPVFLNPDPPSNRGEQMCDNLTAASGTGGAISMFVGATLRAASRKSISPYARFNIGVVNLSTSTTEVVGAYVEAGSVQERQIIEDINGSGTSFMFGAAAGITTPIGTGYQFRLEVRDIINSLTRVTGPANNLGVAPTESKYYHHLGLVMGLDIILERKRGRRY